jgi:hypothetical protein
LEQYVELYKVFINILLAIPNVIGINRIVIGVKILPYYALDIFTVYLNVGFGMAMPEKGDASSDWYINPYIKKSVSNLHFFADLKVGAPDKGLGDSHVHYAIPFGFDCSF